MQNIALPDEAEVEAQMNYADVLPPGAPSNDSLAAVLVDAYAPQRSLALLRAELAMLKAFVRALYAKHGEDCPLFKGNE